MARASRGPGGSRLDHRCLAGRDEADSDPVGSRYDAYNRVLTLALALLLASAVAIRGRVRAAGAAGRRPLTGLVAGLALMLAGNALEFWGSLGAGAEAAATAERLGREPLADSPHRSRREVQDGKTAFCSPTTGESALHGLAAVQMAATQRSPKSAVRVLLLWRAR